VTQRHAIVLLAVAAFVLVSFLVARWLSAENRERTAVVDLLRAQARGDASAMLASLDGCAGDAGCRAAVERNARALRRSGSVRVLRVDSATSHALLADEGPTRVAWDVGGESLPVVQCVQVERRGLPLLGGEIALSAIGPRIAGDAPC
jgi:hypothetical protein